MWLQEGMNESFIIFAIFPGSLLLSFKSTLFDFSNLGTDYNHAIIFYTIDLPN